MLSAVSDLLNRIRSELDDRMAQLRPAADEFARLQRAVHALDQLGASAAPQRAASPAPPVAPSPAAARSGRSGRRRSARTGGGRAAPGQTQLRVIEQLRSVPGSTSTAVSQALGISANAAAATISRLVKQGRVLRLQTGGYGAAQAPPPTDAPAPPPGD
jgi:hypothetical protein